MFEKLTEWIISWITREDPIEGFPMCDFERIQYELRPCDVLLIEGRSRVSQVVKTITQSAWSHACLYIGRIHDVDDIALRNKLTHYFKGEPNVQLIIEGYIGKGTVVCPLSFYASEHIRICRPRGLSRRDAQQVIEYAINQLGKDYNVRQIFDLARFLLPWSFFPRRFRSSLFEFHAGVSTKTICSTMIAEAFGSINFPILPLIKQHEETGIELIKRNPRMYSPNDFDYSPYFEIIKHPFISLPEYGIYRHLPWNREGLISNDAHGIYDPRKVSSQVATEEIIQKKKKLKFPRNLTKNKSQADETEMPLTQSKTITSVEPTLEKDTATDPDLKKDTDTESST